MPVSADKLIESEQTNRRYARTAIAWFGVSPAQVELILRAVQRRLALGENADYLHALVEAGVLSEVQSAHLRLNQPPTEVFEPLAAEADTAEPRITKLDPPPDTGEPTQIGPHRILRKLGQGGMGAVYLAFDSKENRQVAVKVLAAEQAPKQNILRRFQLEGQHGAMLVHPNIIRSYEMGQDATTSLHYIVLEYVDGPSAHDLLERAGKLQVGDALHIVLDIARALEHAHKSRIIHRDIKPGNILVTTSGLAKLSDLGLAKRRDDSANLTHADQGIGTPYYMPYEQAMNAKMADERSDIYALGATLYHLLTGEVPFNGESSLEIVEKKGVGVYPPAHMLNPDVPDQLEGILERMMARDPEDRYQTVSEVIVDIERTGFAAAIPSFINVDTALQDPVVVQRLITPVEATQPDMYLKQEMAEKQAKDQQPWYLKYRDARGTLCKAKASTADILDRLKKGSIPLHTEAARSPQGKFKALEKWPEFQSAVVALPVAKRSEWRQPKRTEESKPTRPPTQSAWWIVGAILGVGIIAALLVTLYLVMRTM